VASAAAWQQALCRRRQIGDAAPIIRRALPRKEAYAPMSEEYGNMIRDSIKVLELTSSAILAAH
jgi:hypothetical protein